MNNLKRILLAAALFILSSGGSEIVSGSEQSPPNIYSIGDGSLSSPSIFFSSQPELGIYRDPANGALVIAGSTTTDRLEIRLVGTHIGPQALYSSHGNALLCIGCGTIAGGPDLLGNYNGTNSNNLWTIAGLPVIQIAGNMSGSAVLQGIASQQVIVSTVAGYGPAKVNNFHAMGCSSDGNTVIPTCNGIEIDGPEASTATASYYGILNHGNAYFDTIYSTVSNLRLGQSAASVGGLGLRNSFPIAWSNNDASRDITAMVVSNDNWINIGTGTQSGVRINGSFTWGSTAISSATSTGGISAVDNITATKSNVQIQAVGVAANIGAYGSGTTYLDAMNAAANSGLRITNDGVITRYSSGAKGIITFPSAGGISITGTGSPSTGGALCLNSSNLISKCTTSIDSSGNCTCP